jgi:hypothetical protein
VSALNLDPNDFDAVKKRKNRNLKVLLGLAALIAVPLIGTTLAASITIGTSGTPVQFGQGITMAAACQTNAITLTPSATYTNAVNTNSDSTSTLGNSFTLGTVAVTGIDSACNNKYFTIKAYDNTAGSTPLTVASGTSDNTRMKVQFKTSGSPVKDSGADYSVTGTSTSFTVALLTKPAAGSVYKFTVETSDS